MTFEETARMEIDRAKAKLAWFEKNPIHTAPTVVRTWPAKRDHQVSMGVPAGPDSDFVKMLKAAKRNKEEAMACTCK